MAGIVTLTVNPTVDVTTSVDRVTPDRKLRCAPPQREPGGGGLNVARAVCRLGGAAAAVWLRGGPTGDLLAGLLDDEGVDHAAVPVSGHTRQSLHVHEVGPEGGRVGDREAGRADDGGRQFRFVLPGPPVTAEEAERTVAAVVERAPALLVLSGSLPRGLAADFYARVARAVPEGTRVIVDGSGAALREAVAAGVYLVKPNLRELGQLVGEDLPDDAAIERAARRLVREDRVGIVLVSLGAGGAVVVTGDGCERLRTPTVPVRSKVGAGDSMVAGVTLALARGEPVGRAVRFGIAAGAAAVMTEGSELCRRDDTERLFAEMEAH